MIVEKVLKCLSILSKRSLPQKNRAIFLKTRIKILRYTLLRMNDDDEITFSDREIVLEFFPATKKALVPQKKLYTLEDIGNGNLKARHISFEHSVILTAIERTGNNATMISCDLCHHSAMRSHMLMYRAHVPEGKQKYRYVSLCANRKNCEERRILHSSVTVFERLFEL